MDIRLIDAKTILSKNKNTAWFGTDYNMNIYRGCSHGCIYCDSRSECYHVDNFDEVRAKKNALSIISRELKKAKGVIATGSMSDPYNHCERELRLTRSALELVEQNGLGLSVCTKSALIERDADILGAIGRKAPVIAKITITAYDDDLCKMIEPRVSPTSDRLKALAMLSDADVYCGVLMMPVLPFIGDTVENALQIARAAKSCGAKFVYPYFGVTLRQNQRDYFFEKLDESFPGARAKYLKAYGLSYACDSPNAKALYSALSRECEKLGLLSKMDDIIRDYKSGYSDPQINFFGGV